MSSALDNDPSGTVVVPEKQEKTTVRKRRRVYGEKVCQVCGDKALAHHFGALACETCKAFFRRNALSKEEKKCLFRGDCHMDVRTRRFCPACRLTKCFAVGMQADLILDDAEKKQRLQKLSEKKRTKTEHQLQQCPETGMRPCEGSGDFSAVSTTGGEVCSTEVVEQAWLAACSGSGLGDPTHHPHHHHHNHPATTTTTNTHSQWGQEGLLGEPAYMPVLPSSSPQCLLMGPEGKALMSTSGDSLGHQSSSGSSYSSTFSSSTSSCSVACLSESGLSPTPLAQPTPQQPPPTEDPGCRPSTPQGGSQLKFTVSFRHVAREQLPSDPYMYWRLTEEERNLLNQLSAAYQDTMLLAIKGSRPRQPLDNAQLSKQGCLQEFEEDVITSISFAKRMEDFRQLRLDEQIALIKAYNCEVLGIQSCALFVAEKEAWLTKNGLLTRDHCDYLFPNHPHIDPSLEFCKAVKAIVKNDVTLYALLHCIMLFDPRDEHIIDRQLVNSIRDKYVILLRHYLESVYSYQHSERYMVALMENLISYQALCVEGKPLIKKFFPSIPNKLILELLDLD